MNPESSKNNSIKTIVRKKICCGCGSCIVICPTSAITFCYGERFNFPVVDPKTCINCGKCLKVCPSQYLLYGLESNINFTLPSSSDKCFLIYATDEKIRNNSASGGFITGLFTYLLENKRIDGCIVTKCEGANPLIAESFIAKDKESLLAAAGSKYAPVSNCTVLKDVINKTGKYAIIGTPCMLEGLTKLENYIPALNKSIVLKIGFVCAGMASRLSTKQFIEKQVSVPLKEIRKISYRGNGWPGHFTVYGKDNSILLDRLLLGPGGSLQNVVGRDHYLRCYNCLDHWSHYADIVVSDPWTEEMVNTEKKGKSAVMVKTERGMYVVQTAIEGGYLIPEPISHENMLKYNNHLIIDKGHPRHSWMQLFQLVFMFRIKYFGSIIWNALCFRLYGAKTTIHTFLTRKYYY